MGPEEPRGEAEEGPGQEVAAPGHDPIPREKPGRMHAIRIRPGLFVLESAEYP